MDDEIDKKHDAMQNMASRPQSLQDYLADQLSFLDIEPKLLNLMRYVIANIDDNGWLTSPTQGPDQPPAALLEELARNYEEPVTVEQVEEALLMVQKLDPLGVGARNLSECLLLQVTPEMVFRDVLRALIQNHLEDIQHNRLPQIQRRTGFDLNTIKEAIEALKHLNPRPGARFTSDNIPYVVPDILVERNETGDYDVRLLDDWVPNIYISRRYMNLYREKGADPKAKEYLKRKIQAATLAAGVDRTAAQHPGKSDPRHHPAPAGLPRQGAGIHRAAQDAADRRPGRRPRHHRQPGRGRQVGANAARHLPAQALLRRRHARTKPPAKRWPGRHQATSSSKSSATRTSPTRSATRTW